MASKHPFKFYRAGGVDQVVLERGADLAHLGELDRKLWAALSMPTRGVHLEARTLELLDTDKDGWVRVAEILGALSWLGEHLVDLGTLLEPSDKLALDKLKDGPLRASARRVLTDLARKDTGTLALADIADAQKNLAATPFNGDGVVTPDVGDAALAKVVEDILATVGGVPDRGGKAGANADKAKAFFADVAALVAWDDKGAAAGTRVIGAATDAAFAAVQAVRAKVDDYFARCRLCAYDTKAAAALGPSEAELTALSSKELAAGSPEIARLPLARVDAGRPLPLEGPVNPAWAGALADLASKAAAPVLGAARTTLTEVDWKELCAKLAPFEAWQAARPTSAVAKLPDAVARARTLTGGDLQAQLDATISKDLAAKDDYDRLTDLEKLLRCQRDLRKILHNFVNFGDFYARKGAVFQAGTLYLDARACELTVEVIDAGKHGTLAPMAGACLVYCDCVRASGEKKAIAAAVTAGDSDNLFVGRNGVFYDRDGKDYQATITKIIDSPISVRQAFWSPYKKFARMIEEQVNKRASAADAAAQSKLASGAEAVAHVDKKPDKPPEPKKIDVGTVAAIGVAIGGIGALITGVLAAFLGLGMWMPIGIFALLLMISGPSMLLAWLKLRRRNLGPLLDAGGWAVNGRARINVAFGGALTSVATLPPGAEHMKHDPYRDKGKPWKLYIFLLVLLALGAGWYLGKLDKYLPKAAKSITVLGKNAPAYKAPVVLPVLPGAPGAPATPAPSATPAP